MSKHVLRSPEGKKVVIDPETDAKLYDAPVNPPNTGTQYLTGVDLYTHKARSGNAYFYLHGWSMWQGSEDTFTLIDRDEAEAFLIEKAGLSGYAGLDAHEIERAVKYGFEIYKEDA